MTSTSGSVSTYSELSLTLRSIQERLRDATRPFLAGRNVALIDFPNHDNCGDSAIWLGEEALLRDVGAKIVYRADVSTYRSRHIAALPKDTILIDHGGGNFGDLWPWHQELREQLWNDAGERQVLQFPQSIKFSSQDAIDRARRALEAVPNVHLFLRDEQSLGLARKHFFGS